MICYHPMRNPYLFMLLNKISHVISISILRMIDYLIRMPNFEHQAFSHHPATLIAKALKVSASSTSSSCQCACH